MTGPRLEVCQLRCDYWSEGGIASFGSTAYFRWVAEKATGLGGVEVIAQSEKARRPSDYGREEELSRILHQKLLQELVSTGWEPSGTDKFGRVSVMKKALDQPMPAGKSDPSELLRQLASLRDADILTQEEFDTKKAEILKRV